MFGIPYLGFPWQIPPIPDNIKDTLSGVTPFEALKIYGNLGSGNILGGIEETIRSKSKTPQETRRINELFKTTSWREMTYEIPSGVGGTGVELSDILPQIDLGDIVVKGAVILGGLYLLGSYLGGRK